MNAKRLFAAFVLAWLVSGCTVLHMATARLQPRDQFLHLETPHAALYYQPDSKEMAKRMLNAMESAISIVEKAHGLNFTRRPKVFVCDEACFSQYSTMGRTVPAGHFLDSVFMNDRVLQQRERAFNMTPESFLVHELAHLLLYQHAGGIAYMQIPAWFREGLAVAVSGGAGAEASGVEEAARSILAGHAFDPAETGSLFHNRIASSYGLRSSVFYRQAGMFVAYLMKRSPAAFQRALQDVLQGGDFQHSFAAAYGQPVAAFWPAFKEQLRALTGKQDTAETKS